MGQGSWLQHSSYNYIDFVSAFREPRALRELARENLADLEKRDVVPWLAPTRLLADQIDGRRNYEREIQLLIDLEINLKAACD